MSTTEHLIYKSSEIITLKLYCQPDGSERVYQDYPTNLGWREVPVNVPSVRQYMELIELAKSNETVRLQLEQLKVVYGLSRD
jgi:hypothetical protein